MKVCADKIDQADKLFKDESYVKAQTTLEEMMEGCHGSGYMERAQFLLAETRYKEEDWVEARGEYTTFVLNFPSSPFAETASFRKALSSYRMSYSDMRDDSPTQTAVRDFDEFVSNYPSSGLLDSAHHYQDSLTNRLGEKDFQTARLYSRMEEPLASAMYLKTFLNQYPTSPRQLEASLMIIDDYIILEQFDPAQFYLDRLAQMFPQAKSEHASLTSKLSSAKNDFEARVKDELKEKKYRKEDAK